MHGVSQRLAEEEEEKAILVRARQEARKKMEELRREFTSVQIRFFTVCVTYLYVIVCVHVCVCM